MVSTLQSTIQDIKNVFTAQGYETPECYLKGKDNNGNELAIGFMSGLKETLIEMAKHKLGDSEIKNYDDNEKIKVTISKTNRALNDDGRFTLATFNDANKDDYYSSIQAKQSICFHGQSGSGKTHISSALCRSFIVNNLETEKIIDFDFGMDVENGRFKPELKVKIRLLKHVSILFFDDFGKTPIMKNGEYNFYGRVLLDIFDYRNGKSHKKNIVTSGYQGKNEIYSFCGVELYRRMFCDGDVDFYKLEKRGL